MSGVYPSRNQPFIYKIINIINIILYYIILLFSNVKIRYKLIYYKYLYLFSSTKVVKLIFLKNNLYPIWYIDVNRCIFTL